jgi:hypothetical protein
MNGCQYLRKTFTLPASNDTSQQKWDMAFLTKEEFMAKYNWDETTYNICAETE